jgi:hypothetical protein
MTIGPDAVEKMTLFPLVPTAPEKRFRAVARRFPMAMQLASDLEKTSN